jgi:lysozyme family protein
MGTRSDNRAFQPVRTDDEAVDLIITWEGGYSFSPGTDPSGADAKNAGITSVVRIAWEGVVRLNNHSEKSR